ncbi:hypothetical protein GCM10023231_26240 [Olivibacter ginsenosidimutans]|uniref:Uncharacterized protein n=1 Tax=Olivibacter ginsenosidimutans TaxID=1176537 RepID=A0ABP9BLB0_9SPHI
MNGSSKTEIEKDYSVHKENPGPAPEALEEKGDKGSGKFLFWILVVMVIILIMAWIFF